MWMSILPSCIYAYMYIHTYMHICKYLYMYIFIYISIYMHTCITCLPDAHENQRRTLNSLDWSYRFL